MDTAIIKGKLHEYIEQADSKHLEAIYVLLEKEMEPSYTYDADTLTMLYERREAYAKGNSTSYTAQEAMNSIRKPKIK